MMVKYSVGNEITMRYSIWKAVIKIIQLLKFIDWTFVSNSFFFDDDFLNILQRINNFCLKKKIFFFRFNYRMTATAELRPRSASIGTPRCTRPQRQRTIVEQHPDVMKRHGSRSEERFKTLHTTFENISEVEEEVNLSC